MRTKEMRGITLIALVITIVIIMILAGVTINLVVGNNNLFDKAKSCLLYTSVEKKEILYMPTWHPAALLRDENKKIDFWKDLKLVKQKADEMKIEI